MDYYYHGTGVYVKTALDVMIEIIESGGIKSKNKRKDNKETLFNGDDYISVAKWDGGEVERDVFEMFESTFYGWIFGCPTFIISPDIETVKTDAYNGYTYDASRDRVSKFRDEYHVKDEIPLDKIVGIAIPFYWVKKDKSVLQKIAKILNYAQMYGWKVFNSDMYLVERVNKDDTYVKFKSIENGIR